MTQRHINVEKIRCLGDKKNYRVDEKKEVEKDSSQPSFQTNLNVVTPPPLCLYILVKLPLYVWIVDNY